MEKTPLVIASVLKPIDDTRMLEKFGLSLAETNKYEINIIGFESKNTPAYDNIHFFPLKRFERLSLKRILAPIQIYRIILKVKPKVLIVNTHELLIVSIIYKILFGTRLYYDIRENYAKNISNTQVFPFLLRPFLSAWVRTKEWLSRPFVKGYLLAERVYARQLPFIHRKYGIIENKYAPQNNEHTAYRQTDPHHLNLVFTGTLSSENGLFEAIELSKRLHQIDPSIRLRIVGYCALKKELKALKEAIQGHDFIELNGGDHLVPHREIIEAIQKADFGFVLKKSNKDTNSEKLLTRLFEYTANHLPILLTNNPHWIDYCSQFNAALVVDEKTDLLHVLDRMKHESFYDQGDSSISLWSEEGKRLVSFIS